MPADMQVWRKLVVDAVGSLADREFQRLAWTGVAPSVMFTRDDLFICFFDDAAIDDYLLRKDTGLSELPIQALKHLRDLMEELSVQTPIHVRERDLPLDDPRLIHIRTAAARFLALLSHIEGQGISEGRN